MAVARASLGGVLGCVLLSLALGSSNVDFGAPPASFYPRFNPFFFLCTHHAEMEGAGVAEGGGEVLLTLQITGNPSSYTPGQEYQVTISTSVPFDGLLVTGLYTSTPVQSAPIPAPAAFGFGVIPDRQFAGTQFVCSVVASHVSHQPSTSFSFVWIAPPPGTGCVNFLATATHRGQIIFKDALAQQLCEQGAPTETPLRPNLVELHAKHAVLRDDFDSNIPGELDPNIWSECSNCEVGEQCGVLLHGRAVTFCEHFGERELTTVPLNTSTASVLQFALGSGSCRFSYSDPSITVSYSLSGNTNTSDDWITLEKIRAPTNSSTVVHLVPLPHSSRGEAVRLRWSQEMPYGPEGYESCWGLDNVLLVNSAHRVPLIEDNLDPLDTSNWLFFPGATIKHACQSEGNALYFHGGEGVGRSFASTRDIDLHREEGRSYWEEDFETPPLNWDIEGAMYGTKCGEIESGAALVFEKEGRRRVCTPYLDTTSYGNLRFHFTMGGGDCDPGESHENNVVLFGRSEGRRERVVLDTLPYSSYRTPSVVSVALPSELQTPVTQFCLEQRSHGGANRHVWAVDFMQLLPVLPGTHTHVAQFSINLGCGSYQPANSVNLEFSTNLGRSWSLLHTECLPELCAGPHLPHSTIYSSDNYSGWTRISIPLPNAALTETTRFRWKQTGTGTGNMWAIDNVYIGPACLRFCSGRGHCSRTGCKCDPGFSGPACELASQTFPAFLSEGFSSPRLSSYHSFSSLRGGEVSFGCGVLASGKALVFNRDGRRHLVTAPLDSSQARYLQFTLRLGSRSILSSCPAPNQPGEGVLLHYSSDNGITWTLLRHYAYQGFHEPRIVSVELPSGARKFGVQFRWWQPYHSGRSRDVWALDEISMTSVLFNTISLDFSNVLDVTQSLGFYLGNVQPYCQHDWTLSFSGEPSPGFSIRYVETQSMQIGASYSLQFSLVMGCGRDPSPHIDTQVRLEFSTNHGLTWHLVKEACLPGMPSCSEFTAPSVYHPSEFKDWRRVTLLLPQKTWSSATRFRWIQSYYGEQDEWALDDIYIGQQCLNMCHGHGWCDHGHCRCDDGFSGQDCQPSSPLSSSVLSDFESQDALLATWQEVIGGEVVAPDMGCGVVSSGSSLYFSKAGLRELVSWDLDTEWAEFVQFYLRVGGDWAECNQADSREEGVLLQYSNDGGISWGLIAEMYFTDFTKPRFVHYELPLASKTPSTRFRWWQPLHSGEGYDQWAIDDVIILSEREKHIIPMANPTLPQNFYEKPAFDYPLNQMSVWLMLGNEGMERDNNNSFCAPTPSAMVFGRSDGDRVAVTRDLALRPGYTLQFKLNIGCEAEFSASAPVLLQYSHDAGRTWALVREGCYPGTPGTGVCEGSSRELREPTVYNTGDYEQWTRITVVIPRNVAVSKTRFRWFQESSVYRDAPPFALDGVYISEPCPNHCGGHGDCISGVCFCDMGFTVEQDSCVPSVASPTELTEGFEGKLSPLWQSISGGQIGGGCGIISEGKALYFSSAGRREARTAPLDTTNTRLAQFYIRIGSKSLGPTCTRPRSRNEGVIVQFSTNNGIQWQFLRELDFSSSLEPQVVTIELPPPAKTSYTVFRWWQPQQGKHSAQWALDDVLIGMNDSSRTGFHDKFDGTTPLRHNWYRIQGGEVTVDCLSLDTALTFNSEAIDKKPRYAESWDFEVTGSSFLQFELSMGCSKSTSFSHGVRLEYSTDCGRHWTLITPECVPPAIGCAGYTQSSVYASTQHKHWRRITVYLPSAANSPRTRFRWIQTHFTPGAEGWALDNVLLAPGCPWMCSGHGLCDNGRCVCDKGYGGVHCVPLAPLPSVLREDFNENLQQETWPEVYGAERGTLSGEPLKSGTALIFKGDGLRMIVSRDLDCSNTLYIQFSFKFITKGVPERSHSVLLQYSVNGGISWLLLDEFYFPSSTDTLFLHLPLPASAQTNATRFRLWQPYNNGKKEEVWVIDDLIIDGSPLHKPPMVIDTFEEGPNEENWLFYPGGNTGLYCPYQKAGLEDDESAMVFISSELGEHSITTRDIDVNENTIIQFEINVGCTTESSSANPVRLEFSRDFGATWHLLVPLCAGGPQPSSLCSTELHPASIYFPGTTHGWRRELIHVGKLRLCGSIRFRWFQGYFSAGSAPPTWALDNVYIGPQCQDMCNGHGVCVSGTHCVCDPSFSGPDCSVPEIPNPDFLKEDFEGGAVDAEHFTLLSGGKPSRKCGIMSSGNHLFFSEDGLRMLVTNDMDLSNARFVQFFLRLGCGKAAPDPRSQPVLLQFSVDGGLTWGLLQEFLFSNASNQARLVALEIPLRARTPATRLRWWQPSENGHFYSPWVIDQVVVGGSASGWGPLEDDFSSIDGRSWLLHPGGTRMPVCGSDGPAFAFIEKSNTRYAVTTDISLGQDAFIQFDFSASCSVTNSCYSVELEYSLDLGLTWQPLVRDCLPTSPDCSSYTLQRILVSDTYNKWGRVTLSIPSYARSPATRFRWFQQAPFDKQQTWALDNLYIGDGCPDMCSGHGRCQQSSCVCDPEWGGEYCDEPVLPLPSQLKDSFSRAPSLSHWHVLTGGKLSSVCGAVASGAALHFSGSCTRQLVTVDLNLTNAEFIQFYFMYGCMIPPSNRNQGVLLEYSLNGGINWHLLTEIFYDLYTKPGFVNVLLPPAARQEGVRVRWWQPQHEGADRSDWALDNVLIAGSDPRAQISDTFGGVALPNHERAPADETSGRVSQLNEQEETPIVSDHWLFSEDCSVQRFCNSPDGVMVCGNADGREVYAVTRDIVPNKGWVMQFKIAVGCNVPDRPADRQIHVQYSVDFGVTWKYLVPQCLPADPRCGGQVSQPSVFFPAESWKRAVYPLPDSLAETAVRFRFYQQHSDIQWGVENLYIGPPCDGHCGGHGDCLDQRCICDPGFTGPNCFASTALKASLKERFDWEGGAGPQWQVLEGGKPCTDCGVLVEGTALYFGGADARQAVTADLDLRGAKFVEYWARIGSDDNMTMCHRPTCRKEGVLLDYSTDGGVSWTLLHEMDYLKYVSVRRDYIVLPEVALTNATRLRWWQPFTISSGLASPSLERAQWAIDNILVGGSDINPSTLLDTFDDEGVSHEESWSFYPNAVRTAGFCGNPSFHLYWPNKNQDRTHNILATRELIVQPGYILQFKIVVGCEADTCEDHHSVLLQYRKDAQSDSWQLVQSECLPSSVNNVGCSPFQFHESTIYSPVNSSTWTRVTVQLPDHVSSGATQFRWIQKEGTGERHSWGVDNVYIGEACPGLCSGHGYCTSGAVCICDEGYHGDDCSLSSTDLPSSIKDNFESGVVSPESWQLIHGGGVGSGCGQLSPHAHGDSLYFSGCKLRQAVTKPLDLTRARYSKIMFVLQIGSVAQTDSCNIALDQADTVDRAVLLQYSVNNGVSWHVIAQHQPKDFIKAQRVSYNIPLEARVKGVMLRWWQPRHDGAGHDQWALDHVEVVLLGLLPPQTFLQDSSPHLLPIPSRALTSALFCILLPLAWL
ncbi:reelin isoform X1 [Xiphophorus maculatus]|uniref:reelin isoform X1 n=1 Tax=Xiphophorus maculatus TaxID=8083 RepID=UPI000C6D1EC3|nr:reelin isoform X1 [Xiphophorus maculatus]